MTFQNTSTRVSPSITAERILVLARGELRAFLKIDGTSVFEDVVAPTTLMASKVVISKLRGNVPEHVELIETKWSHMEDSLDMARQMHAERPFTAIASISEMFMLEAGLLRDEFGIKGLSADMSLRFRDKCLMKRILRKHDVRVPEFRYASEQKAVRSLQKQYGQIVMKPVDGMGSKGVEFISSPDELDNWFADCNNIEEFEAEEFVDGTLYHVNAVVVDGVAQITLSAPYLPGMGNVDFVHGRPMVSHILGKGELNDRLTEFSNSVISALEMRDGITHLECFVKPDGEIVFCEVGARPGGGGIVLMMEASSGLNYIQALLLVELGRADEIKWPSPDNNRPPAALMGIRWPSSGFVNAIPERADFPESWVDGYLPEYSTGDFVAKAAHCADYIGLLIFSSKHGEEFTDRQSYLENSFLEKLDIQAL